MKMKRLVKCIVAIVLPSLLTALVAIQVHMCRNSFDLRNSYLLENLPSTSEKVWDAIGGNMYPYILPSLLQLDSQSQVGMKHGRPAVHSLSDNFLVSKERWEEEKQLYAQKFRESVLKPGLPSLTVHFLWCIDGYFELTQYITIMSLLYQFRPDKIVIHYRVKPRSDPHGYWRWLEDLERDIVILSLKPLEDAKHCSHALSSGVSHEHFSDPHGIFILGDVVITNLTRPDIVDYITKSFFKGKTETGLSASYSSLRQKELSQSQVFIVPDTEPFHISQSPGRVVIPCPTSTYLNNAPRLSRIPCVSMQSYISPDELFHIESRFHNYIRALIYGSEKPVEVNTVKYVMIPKIVHIVLKDGECSNVSPLLYFSIKSAYKIGQVDQVFIHCQNQPRGELWERLFFHDHLEPKYVPSISLTKPSSLKAYLLYTLLQHGGIATLGDVIFTKPINSMPLYAGALATIKKSQYRQRHQSLSMAILGAMPGSQFIQDVLGMVYQPEQLHIKTGIDEIATHISEINPKSVLIDSLLVSDQVCQGQRCMIAPGHDSPSNAYSTRFQWNDGKQPESLAAFVNVEGPARSHISKLV